MFDNFRVLPLEPVKSGFKATKAAAEFAGEGLLSLWKSAALMGGELCKENPEREGRPECSCCLWVLSAWFPLCWVLVRFKVKFHPKALRRMSTWCVFLVKWQYFYLYLYFYVGKSALNNPGMMNTGNLLLLLSRNSWEGGESQGLGSLWKGLGAPVPCSFVVVVKIPS